MMRKRIIILLIFLLFVVFIISKAINKYNRQMEIQWFPEKIYVEKDTVKIGKTTYLIKSHSLVINNNKIMDSLKYFPVFDRSWNDKYSITWKAFDELEYYEKEGISKFLSYENMDTLEMKKEQLMFSGFYSKMKPDNSMSVMMLGILDLKNNRFYSIEWVR
jgi:hypothetical protein